MKILIAYDGSTQADNAIADLAMAGLPPKAEALILGVAMPWAEYFGLPDPASGQFGGYPMESVRAFDRQARLNADADAVRAAASLKALFPGWKTSAYAAVGNPAREILAKAESWKADLIVVGSHGRTAFGRLLLGSVSQKILHHARTAVRVARKGPSKPRAPRLLVGFDGSPDCEEALKQIAARSWPKGTRVRMVAAFNNRLILENLTISKSLKGDARITGLTTNWTERRMAAVAKKLKALGLSVEYEWVYGDPRRELLKQASEWPADCIFLGSRGLNAMERFLIGSVSSAVAGHAKCTVEIIRSRAKRRRAK